MEAPAIYARWWLETERCSGLTSDFRSVQWYRVPDAAIQLHGDNLAGYYSKSGPYISLAAPYIDDGDVVRHEMLHALLRRAGHPRDQFLGRCKDVVGCPGQCAMDAGPWHAAAPFIPVPVDSLPISSTVELLPREADGQRWVALTVTVVNPLSTAVYAVPNGARFAWGAENGVVSWSLSVDDSAALYFDAHQTRKWTLEMRVADATTQYTISPGLHGIDGGFGQHWTPFTELMVAP